MLDFSVLTDLLFSFIHMSDSLKLKLSRFVNASLLRVFSGTPRQTIKSHMWTLGLNLVRCRTIVLHIARKDRPGLCNYYNVISLIPKRDVFVLQAYHQSHVQNESRCLNLGNAHSCASYLPKASRDLWFIDLFVLGMKLFNCPLLFVILEWYSIPVLIWKTTLKRFARHVISI